MQPLKPQLLDPVPDSGKGPTRSSQHLFEASPQLPFLLRFETHLFPEQVGGCPAPETAFECSTVRKNTHNRNNPRFCLFLISNQTMGSLPLSVGKGATGTMKERGTRSPPHGVGNKDLLSSGFYNKETKSCFSKYQTN